MPKKAERLKSGRYSIVVRDKQVIALADWRPIDIMASQSVITGEEYRAADELWALWQRGRPLPGAIAGPMERAGGRIEHDPDEQAMANLNRLLGAVSGDEGAAIWQVVIEGRAPMAQGQLEAMRAGLKIIAEKV
jgi:hypothetical protein|tara:strand:- start:52 stop:453 length:402 start_codon:yes stop_codon:yes gene_type:complete